MRFRNTNWKSISRVGMLWLAIAEREIRGGK